MKFRFNMALFFVVFFFSTSFAEITIKLGTIAPQGSPWHDILKDMGDQWKVITGGAVSAKIFAGGVAGDEPDMIRKMRIGQLHAGAVTSVGLGSIDESTSALQIPLAFSSYEELDYVRDRIAPRLEAALAQKGFIVLNWGDGGWVYFFVQKPTPRIEDLKKMKLFVWAGDPAGVDLWKDFGFQPVPLATTDVLPALQTGMVNAFDTTPLFALSSQWFPFCKYMIDLKWAPLTGATIISKKMWDKIPPDQQKQMMEVSQEAGKKLRDEIRRLEKDAIEAMKKRGVQVVPVPPEIEKQWRDFTLKAYPRIRGTIVPADYFNEILRLRDQYRNSKK